jgi:hypothetical protein
MLSRKVLFLARSIGRRRDRSLAFRAARLACKRLGAAGLRSINHSNAVQSIMTAAGRRAAPRLRQNAQPGGG